MDRLVRSAALIVVVLFLPHPSWAGLLSLSVVSGLTDVLGGTPIQDPILQETLSSSTLTQLGSPLLLDPETDLLTSLTVRVTNTSASNILFPEFLPGVSVLTGINGITGYSSRLNVGAGGAAGRDGALGTEGAISRTVLDTAYDLVVAGTPVSGSNGGGGGTGTAVAENWVALRGASGEELAAILSGLVLAPGEWIDIPDFARITAFHRLTEGARLAIGFDLPTFNSGGITVTTGAWTGTFSEARIVEPPVTPPSSVPEPAAASLLMCGLALGAARRGFAASCRDRGQNRARE